MIGQPIALGNDRVLRPGRSLWLRTIAWLIFCVFAVALSFGLSAEVVATAVPGGTLFEQFLARSTGPTIALACYALLVWSGEARLPAELALRPALPELAAGLLLGLIMFAAVMLIMTGFGLYQVAFLGFHSPWSAAGVAVEAGVVEEIMVRGLILRLVWRAFGPVIAFAVSAAAFGVGHMGNANVSLFAILCIALEAGVMLGAFYALTGRLWLSIGVHVAWNFTQGYVFGAAVSGETLGTSMASSIARKDLPNWLTGGPFGPEASLPALLVCSAVGAVTLWLAFRAGRFAQETRLDTAGSQSGA